jgi:uncharacterized protein (TIGR03086 family)
MDLIDALDETFTNAGSVIAGVRRDQYADKTPCTEWTVEDLLNHMIGVVGRIGAAVGGVAPTPFELGSDPAAQFRELASVALAAWRKPGVFDRTMDVGAGPMPGRVLASINLLDTATHTWDLATATGQAPELPPAVAEVALSASRTIITEALRPGRFGPEQPAPAGASATQQLASFLGRTP